MSIAAELEEVAGVKLKGKEPRQKYLTRAVKAVEALDDADWDKLSDDTQKWYKVALKQDGEGEDITDFAEDEPSETEPVEAAEADEDAAAEESAEENEAPVSTTKTKKAPAKKVAKAKTEKKAAAPKTAKPKRAGNGAAFKKVGVMAEIKRMLQRKSGATVKEIVESLTEKFPDRPEKGMTISAKAYIYVAGPKEIGKKLKKVKDEKRGAVFTLPASA